MNFLAPQVELDPIAKAWIHENIVAKEYRLTHLEGKFDLKRIIKSERKSAKNLPFLKRKARAYARKRTKRKK